MNADPTLAAALLYREAALLDERRWDDWLALFTPDAEYWVPAWRDEDEPTADPRAELSLIYYRTRAGLEDRVWRVRSRRSVASAVLPRTQHVVTNIRVADGSGPDLLKLQSNWTTQQFLPKEKVVETYFGRQEHDWHRVDGCWRIARKKVLLLNDYLNAKLDFYNL
ncbi:2-halobenzoate 1,2-dioxygenase small subunit [Pigmentiphaga humi]|uniref:2-halobenzoate 1,2-dioxygenase small subunit n=1 Tax=Pigmentiphaga humi TaxID=2478468 RepID=A0A3P4B9H3_9BURK|nr:aromatic-ring-hydroxylating dioxygenase subunit beta [Pigmentiphaga humi]VCU71785.1 2-halobenzoate 1,2-dioxygenase small subunit [Pigmentiphaga humi]